MQSTAPGRYIAFTGIDGSGKSTQAGRLAERLRGRGRHVYLAEAKENYTVEVLTSIAHRRGHGSPRGYYGHDAFDLMRSLDALRDHTHLVAPLLVGGSDVVAPRSPYCRLALMNCYGNRNRGLVEEILFYAGGPDLVLMIDIPAEVAHQRILQRQVDREDLDLLMRFREELRMLAAEHGWPVIAGDRPPDDVSRDIDAAVDEFLSAREETG